MKTNKENKNLVIMHKNSWKKSCLYKDENIYVLFFFCKEQPKIGYPYDYCLSLTLAIFIL